MLLRLAAGARPPSGARGAFTRAFGRWLGVPHVHALDSARTALALLLRALGIGRGARVIVPAYTFYTLPAVVRALGARPVFAPVDPATQALDPDGLPPLLEGAAAVLLIHPFGQLGPVAEVADRCRAAGVPLIEDASQSTGAALAGRRAGSFGRAAVFSLVSGKNLQAFGGGLLATADAELDLRIRELLTRAGEPDHRAVRGRLRSGLVSWALTTRPGFALGAYPVLRVLDALDRERLDACFREPRLAIASDAAPRWLSEAQAGLGLLDLAELADRNARRRQNARHLLAGLRGVPGLGLPRFDPRAENTFNAVAVRVDAARALAGRLLRLGVDTREDYMDWCPRPPADAREVLYLPNHPGLAAPDIDRTIAAVWRVCGPGLSGS